MNAPRFISVKARVLERSQTIHRTRLQTWRSDGRLESRERSVSWLLLLCVCLVVFVDRKLAASCRMFNGIRVLLMSSSCLSTTRSSLINFLLIRFANSHTYSRWIKNSKPCSKSLTVWHFGVFFHLLHSSRVSRFCASAYFGRQMPLEFNTWHVHQTDPKQRSRAEFTTWVGWTRGKPRKRRMGWIGAHCKCFEHFQRSNRINLPCVHTNNLADYRSDRKVLTIFLLYLMHNWVSGTDSEFI